MILGEVGINLGPLLAGAGHHRRRARLRLAVAGARLPVGRLHPRRGPVRRRRHRRPRRETSGVVEAVSLRTTRLRAVDGTLWHVPNGEIRRVGNQSQHWSRALIDIEVAYETDIDHAAVGDRRGRRRGRARGRRRARRARRSGASSSSAPTASRSGSWSRPARREQFRVSRELRARIKIAFDREGIEIPFPQQTVWHRQPASAAP